MHVAFPILLSLAVLAPSQPKFTNPKSAPSENGFRLTQKEAKSGWISLFDGKPAFGWGAAKAQGDQLIGGTTTTTFGN